MLLEETFTNNRIVFGHSTRFVIMIISILCLTFVMANSLALNFTVICMTKPLAETGISNLNGTNEQEPEPIFSLFEKSWLFSAVAIGQILGTLPITYFTANYGVRKTFTAYGLISGFSTFFLPTSVSFGFYFVFLMRVLEGFAMATSFPSLGSIVAEWSTVKSNGMFIALLSIHLQLGPIFTMPVSGLLCASTYSWPSVYYLQGGITLFSFIIFYYFYRDSPQIHKHVSQKELIKITSGKCLVIYTNGKKQRQPVPYWKILKDISVWGIFISCFGGTFGFQILSQYGPTYLNKVLGFDLAKTGFAAAFPFILSICFKLIAAPFSDRFTLISQKARIIMFNSMAQFPMSICLILLAVLPTHYTGLIQASYIFAGAFCGLNAVGIAKSIQLIAQQHCHFILALNTFIQSTIMLILPPIVSFIAPDNTNEQWGIIFYGIAAIVSITAIIFNCTAEASPRPWVTSNGTLEEHEAITTKEQVIAIPIMETMDKEDSVGHPSPTTPIFE
uniref:Major facilitator superfamily (MFS) profile domain-containing protein n=1 Tax=Panagrolaimus sp. PS1159 TaxID=55785 RepID=A0AC35GNB5_9BILA